MPEVFSIGRTEAGEAAEVLAQAFLNESATDYFFPPEEGDKLEKLRALFGWAVEYRLRTGLPLLGVRSRALAGVATLRTPILPDLAEAEALWLDVARFLGPAAEARMDRYEEAQQRHKPKEPHHYLVAIGVHPDFQGRGLGGALLRASIALADADSNSAGLALDTGSEANQRLYEHFGFRVLATEVLDDKLARFMFRPARMKSA